MSVQPLHLRRFGLVYSFLRAAVDALDDSVFSETGAHEPLGTDELGKPRPPDEFYRRVTKLNQADASKLVASSCVAGISIGHAYEHAFKLLHHIETGSNPGPSGEEQLGLDRLYDLLPQRVRDDLDAVYVSVKSHELAFEEKFDNPDPWTEKRGGVGSTRFRQDLNYWESQNLLRGHAKYADADLPFEAQFLIPLRSLEIVDRILADVLAPRLNLRYTRFTGDEPPKDNPNVKWENGRITASLPVRHRLVEASWEPTVTSVIRVREVGEEEWSVGFETPLNACGFVGLRPGVQYEVQVTYKGEAGESPPSVWPLPIVSSDKPNG